MGANRPPQQHQPYRRRVLEPDQVEGFAEVPATERRHQVAKQFQPFLTILTGCVPHPAVDAGGNVSAGQEIDSIDAGCTSSPGQVYCRMRAYRDRLAVVYAWYFPKDCPAAGHGHRHDWEAAVLWLQTTHADHPCLQAISYSQHGQYRTAAPTAQNTSDGRPLLAYRHDFPANHCLWIHDQLGQDQPLIDWDDLTDPARRALNTHDFGAANVPLNDVNLTTTIQRAWPARWAL